MNQQDLIGFVCSVADQLCGKSKWSNVRRIILPCTELRRLKRLLAPTRKPVLDSRA